ncbi:YbhB/YbcL family Raf kinase inhibitor-like protein [Streptomyces sp. NPDC058231]|uniref:YbhB/YbcL family Raf kinase inhibitor-like protein n=1 Tax=Streptomyces sp. NPDC058231 TaxID=3346392 RepID=UPI0036EB8184
MTLLGKIMTNRRAGETQLAWNRPNLSGPELLTLTSQDFVEGAPIPLDHAGRRVGGKDLSPCLTWNQPSGDVAQLLLVIEDIDVPMTRPFVHGVSLIDPTLLDSPGHLPGGALSAREPAAGVRVLRSGVGRGYRGPGPIKGHGPHRYTFQLFALADAVDSTSDMTEVDRARPRAFLASLAVPVVARGRLTGTFER